MSSSFETLILWGSAASAITAIGTAMYILVNMGRTIQKVEDRLTILEEQAMQRKNTTDLIFRKLDEIQKNENDAHREIIEKIHQIELKVANLNVTGCKPSKKE